MNFSKLTLVVLGSIVMIPAISFSAISEFGKFQATTPSDSQIVQVGVGASAINLEVGKRITLNFVLTNSGNTPFILYDYVSNKTITNSQRAKVTNVFLGETPEFSTQPKTFDFLGPQPFATGWNSASVNNTNSELCDANGPSGPLLGLNESASIYMIEFEGVEPGEYIITSNTTGTSCANGVATPAVFSGDPVTILVTAPVVATSVPTLSEWGIMFLTMLLSIGAVFYIRGHRSA